MRFFIDTSDERFFVKDEDGREYEDLDAARVTAISALPDMARDELPDGDNRTFLALVRDEAGHTLIQVNLTLRVTWLTDARNPDARNIAS